MNSYAILLESDQVITGIKLRRSKDRGLGTEVSGVDCTFFFPEMQGHRDQPGDGGTGQTWAPGDPPGIQSPPRAHPCTVRTTSDPPAWRGESEVGGPSRNH